MSSRKSLISFLLIAELREDCWISPRSSLPPLPVSTSETIRRFERGDQRPYQSTLAKIREALERRGIEFTNGDSPGVRLRPEHSILQ